MSNQEQYPYKRTGITVQQLIDELRTQCPRAADRDTKVAIVQHGLAESVLDVRWDPENLCVNVHVTFQGCAEDESPEVHLLDDDPMLLEMP
jgi:hypothetical protein